MHLDDVVLGGATLAWAMFAAPANVALVLSGKQPMCLAVVGAQNINRN